MATNTFTAAVGATSMFKSVHDALIACGMVQTSDTGQLNLTTAPTGNTTAGYLYGYTVYRWNDDYQATYPLYIRINWLNITATNGYRTFQPIVGEGTDGAGNITGKSITFLNPPAGYSTYSGTTGLVSVVDGCVTIAHAVSPTNLANFFTVERLRNIDGTKVNGFYGLQTNEGASVESFITPSQTSAVTISPFKQIFFPYHSWATQPLTAVGSDIPFVPKTILDPSGRTLLGSIAVPTTEVPYDYNFTVNRFGINRTFKSLGAAFTFTTIIGGTNAPANSICFAVPWE